MQYGLKTAIFAGLFAASGCTSALPAAPADAPVAASSSPAAAEPARLGCETAGPTPESLPGATPHIYASRPTRDLRLHVFAPANAAPAHPAIVFFFGGGWRTGSPTIFADRALRMAKEGYVAIVPDYRVSCRDETTPADSAADATAAYDWVRGHADDLNIDVSRIVLSGGSAGGHIALTAALKAAPDQRPAALVLFNPAVFVPPRFGLSPQDMASISPSVLPVDGAPPTIVLHGDADTTVPIQSVRDFCKRMTSAGRRCELKEYPGKAHGFFQRREPDPALGGVSAYDETLGQAIAFLKAQGIAP